jgi:futalosine hydrolase
MKILVTAATQPEIQPFLDHLARMGNTNGSHIDVLISGIGLMHTAWSLGRRLAARKPDIAIQAGIGGCFSHERDLGQVVIIEREQLGDLGAEDQNGFTDLFDIGLWKAGQPPFEQHSLVNSFAGLPSVPELPRVTAVSVNTVSGRLPTIQRLQEKYAPEMESMEGAAFHYGCLLEKVPFLQLRSISNYVEVRDKSRWNIPLAVKQLNGALVNYITQLIS